MPAALPAVVPTRHIPLTPHPSPKKFRFYLNHRPERSKRGFLTQTQPPIQSSFCRVAHLHRRSTSTENCKINPDLFRQFRLDRADDLGRIGLRLRLEPGDDCAIAGDEEFLEIPGDGTGEGLVGLGTGE